MTQWPVGSMTEDKGLRELALKEAWDVWQAQLQERRQYEARFHAKKENGNLVLKRSLNGPCVDTSKDVPAALCAVEGTITVPWDDRLAKFLLDTPYGLDDHRERYGRRNLSEVANWMAKDTNYSGLADASRRRVRGFAKQYLLTVLTAVAVNLRAVQRWVQNHMDAEVEAEKEAADKAAKKAGRTYVSTPKRNPVGLDYCTYMPGYVPSETPPAE